MHLEQKEGIKKSCKVSETARQKNELGKKGRKISEKDK